jgi:integrase
MIPEGAAALPTIKLTQLAIERLKPPTSGRVEYWDSQLPGFGLRVSAPRPGKPKETAQSYQVMCRVKENGAPKLVRLKLGTVAEISVGDARKMAGDIMVKARQGINPAAAARRKSDPSIFEAVAADYVKRYAKKHTKPTTWQELERQLRVDVLPKWADRPIGSITRQDVTALLGRIADRGSPVQANRTLTRLKTLFKWALDEELISSDPTARVRKVIKEEARDRVLSDDEIRFFWVGCEGLGWPFGALFQLLLMTAQRRDEVGTMEWSEIDLDKRLWVMPREKAKNNWAHEVHLSEFAVEIIKRLQNIRQRPRFIFTTNGRPVSGFSRAKTALDRRMGEFAGTAVEPWILHDLRRTAATGMARLNIAPHVVDKILNHVSGTIRGVAAVYNRHSYTEERKAALEAWGRYIESLVRPTQSNVLDMRRRAEA